MPTDTNLESAARRFKEDVPHRFQVSLTMSVATRDRLRAVQDALNDDVEARPFSMNDVMKIAMAAGVRYHAIASGDVDEPEPFDEDELLPLAAVLREVIEAEEDEILPPAERDST